MPEFNISSRRKQCIDRLVENLPSYRKMIGVSQTVLSEKIGKSRQTVSDIERGKAPLGWDTYIAIVLFFESNGLFDVLHDTSMKDALFNDLKI